ncbi:CB1 cannabinoid receptor-interacting protein 1-like [Pomacea canaliculata]|uniref:CB1 cannabinoid receptor-interacting protein 1-like n=1 Tax=Pomacea canaliculata TaxID=400727 RepID=UPI000D737AFA|nr:CB1 cannabinoid receptor-interacting protein 1-like [Pomacea canaliculata]
MRIGHTYKINVCFRPPRKLLKWTIQGEKTLFTQALPSKANEDLSVYSTIWTVDGFEVTRRGRREKIHFFFELERGQILTTTLQVKFYASQNQSASQWGQPMHALDLLCDSQPGQSAVVVRRGSIL